VCHGLLRRLLEEYGAETMNDDERRRLENQLIVMGLNKLTDPELVPQMAKLIPDGGTLAAMLNECDQAKRGEMYYALKPYLPFKPLPLENYLDFFKRRADAIDSEYSPVRLGEPVYDDSPVMMGGRKFREVSASEAEACIMKLTCHKCTKAEEFMGLTPVQAVSVARADGWKRDLALQKEICPKCAAGQMKRKKRVRC
jgi:hypothetical protein